MPKRVALDWAALEWAAHASAQRLGTGNWLVALPLNYVAGVMAAVRAHVAGGSEEVLERLENFHESTARLATPRFTSLVPYQLEKLLPSENEVQDISELSATQAANLEALRSYSCILVGGQRLSPAIRYRAQRWGMPVVETYGSTETSGGCVYDGVPLDGVNVRLGDDSRLWVSSPSLAVGYVKADGTPDVERTAHSFIEFEGKRWYRTDDRAHVTVDEHGLEGVFVDVLGRADDVLISGGLKLDVAQVQHALDSEWGPVMLAFTVDNTRWGQSLGVHRVIGESADADALSDADIANWLTTRFGPAAHPLITSAPEVFRLPGGKSDRLRHAELARAAHPDASRLGSITDDE